LVQILDRAGLPQPYYADNTVLEMTVADKALTPAAKPATKMVRQSIAAGMVMGFIDYAETRGADRASLMAMVGLAERGKPDPNRRVPFSRYVAMLRHTTQLTNDPALVVKFAEASHFGELSIVGLIGYASETMRDALDQLNRFGRLVTDVATNGPDRFTLVHEADGLWLIDNRIDEAPFPELTESTFVRMVSGTRQFGSTPFVSLVDVTHIDQGSGSEFQRIVNAPVRYGAPRNALRVSMAWQDYRISLYPRYAFGLFCAHADRLLSELDAEQTVVGQVERAILPVLHTGQVKAHGVAKQLGLSDQGLYRALRAEGTTFEKLLAELRHRFAQSYLTERRTSMKEIAYLLGYSDVSAFSRAFRRMEGLAPKEYQNNQN
jgi:AraC-like DNA-binding protein